MLPVLALRVAPGSRCLDVCASPGSKTQQLPRSPAARASAARGDGGGERRAPARVAALLDALGRHGRSAASSRASSSRAAARALPAPARPWEAARRRRRLRPRALRRAVLGRRHDPEGRERAAALDARRRQRAARDAAGDRVARPRAPPRRRLLCYSTCSLNPIEDEAVVAAAGRARGGRAEAWPADVLPALRRARAAQLGVADDADADDARRRRGGGAALARELRRGAGGGRRARGADDVPPAAADAARLRLERCSRLLPHDQDTGGFFVALLRNARRSAGGGGGGEAAADGELPPQLLQRCRRPRPRRSPAAPASAAAPRAAGCSARRARAATARCASRRPASPPSRRARCAS